MQIPLFVESVLHEFQHNPPPKEKYSEISTVYFGGGTPSMLSGKHLEKILTVIDEHIPLKKDVEITLEANPGEVDLERLQAYKSLGVNRISFGLQSFNDKHLEILGRLHRSMDNRPSIDMARKVGFENISVDLIFHMPEQSFEHFKHDLQHMVSLDIEHISIYSLTVEENTPLFTYVENGRIQMTSDDLDARMYRFLSGYLCAHGYEHYEISNLARPGFRSRHNTKYWDGSHYFGYGPSAHSYDGGFRWWNVRDLAKYFVLIRNNNSPIVEKERLDRQLKMNEYLLTRLRTSEGISRSDWIHLFYEEFPESLSTFFKDLALQHPEWVHETADGWRLRPEGWLFANSIVEDAVNILDGVHV